MINEAEISITGISCHDTLLPKIKQIKGGGGVMYLRCVSLTKTDS